MPLGREAGLGPGDIVLDGDPAPLPKIGAQQPPLFGPCRWIKMPLDMEVGLGAGHIVLDGDQAPLPQRGTVPQFSAHVCCGQTPG